LSATESNACLTFTQAVELLVELASLQTSFLTLDEAIKTTNRRVNALENVVKPKLENTISYIKGELDELEREEFFRLKKVQANKKKVADRELKVRGAIADHMCPVQVPGPIPSASLCPAPAAPKAPINSF
jgi:V-type H+-transporting ATPase subunit D